MSKQIIIGSVIQFNKAYDAKLSKRAKNYDCSNKYIVEPLVLNKNTGYIVGLRYAMMKNITYHPGKTTKDDFRPPYAAGKVELCYLVTLRAFGKHFLVRECDKIKITVL